MRNFKIVAAIIILSLLLINCKNSKYSIEKQNTTKIKIDSVLTSMNKNGKFNGNVLVAKNDKIIYNNSFGFADGSKKTVLKKTHRFNIGSIYKEIPAIAIMQLKEKQLLNLNDPISKYLKELPDWSNQITIQYLLQYTSGLPKISWGKHPEINDKVLMEDLIQIDELQSSAGENYFYSNYSPFLLSKIVERISKSDFKTYVNQEILEPLQLKNSGFNTSFPYQNRNGMAISFNSEFVEDNPPFKIKSPMFLFSTTTMDLYDLIKGLHSNKLINKESLELISKTAKIDVKEMESPLGQVEYENGKIVSHMHHGSSGNYEGLVSVNFKNKTTIIVLTNSNNGNVHNIIDKITEIVK